jgi:RNA polymerase primary sigma factor
MESQHPEYRPLLDLDDRAVGRMIKLAKRRGYVMYDVLKGLMPPEVFAQREIKDVIDQFAEMGINVVGEPEAMRLPDRDEPGITAEDERSTDDQPKAPHPPCQRP